ncbi:MAG: ORF6N domain-containing protein [Bacteroidia bacterium]
MELIVIQKKIYEIRGHKVMLDFDLAQLYEVETRTLKQAVKRNIYRFPSDIMIELTRDEYNSLRSQFVTLEKGRGKYSKYLPFGFTEQGVAMLSSILNSRKAIDVNISIMRAFVMMRQLAYNYKELADKIVALEQKYNKNFADVYEALNLLLLDKEEQESLAKRKRIGFKIPKK